MCIVKEADRGKTETDRQTWKTETDRGETGTDRHADTDFGRETEKETQRVKEREKRPLFDRLISDRQTDRQTETDRQRR